MKQERIPKHVCFEWHSLVSPSSCENMRKPLFISFFRGANMSSVTGMGRSSSGGIIPTIAPFEASSADTRGGPCFGIGLVGIGSTTGFRSACCTWCAANTSSLHSIPL